GADLKGANAHPNTLRLCPSRMPPPDNSGHSITAPGLLRDGKIRQIAGRRSEWSPPVGTIGPHVGMGFSGGGGVAGGRQRGLPVAVGPAAAGPGAAGPSPARPTA